jgi:hypothetical protein
MTKTPNTLRKALLTALAVGGLGAVAGLGTFSAFSATTTNAANSITSGTVKIDQHTSATTLFNVSNQKPGDSTSACVRLTYSGSLGSTVKIYTSSSVTNGSLYNLRVERGSGLTTLNSTMSCAGFTPAADVYSTGTLGNFASSYTSFSNGLDARGSAWAQNDTVDYRVTITQNDDTTANAHTSATSSGPVSFVWEARNN